MATVRIYKVAELLNTSSQEVMALLKRDHGIEVKSASSTIEEVVARQFVDRLARQRNVVLPTGPGVNSYLRTVTLNRPYALNEVFTVKIVYNGVPVSRGVTKENSFVAQMTTSSAKRDMSTAVIAATNANSATKSREAVPSMEFSTEVSKPRSAATASGSRPSEDPASAPLP